MLDRINPRHGTIIPRKAAAPAETHATTPDEVVAMLDVFRNAEGLEKHLRRQAQLAIGLMFFTGLRPGEARGARWEDYHGKILSVKQGVWRKHTTLPKTAQSAKPVLVIEPLRELLAVLPVAEGSPETGPILRGVLGKSPNLDMLAKRVIRPALRNPNNYRNRDAKPLAWHGYYALRRGIGTHLTAVTGDPNAAKGLLRHTSLATTLNHYVKDMPQVTANGMAQVEQLFSKLDGQAVQ